MNTQKVFMPLAVTIQTHLERQQEARQGLNGLNRLGIICSSHSTPAR